MNDQLAYFWVLGPGMAGIFETHINGSGYYDDEHRTILGQIYNADGTPQETTRVRWVYLTPMHPAKVKRHLNRKAMLKGGK
jgi:hypothetical protein